MSREREEQVAAFKSNSHSYSGCYCFSCSSGKLLMCSQLFFHLFHRKHFYNLGNDVPLPIDYLRKVLWIGLWPQCGHSACQNKLQTLSHRQGWLFLTMLLQLFLLEGSSTIYFLCFLIMFFVLFCFLAAWKTWSQRDLHCNPSSTTGWHVTPDAL